jgi:predicted component of type VI protein secretion system
VDAPERALRRLRDAYGAGHVSTATLEVRAAAVLSGAIEDAVWDLPGRRRRAAAPVRALVAGEREWPLAERGHWVLGRGSGCDVALGGDDSVSRRHAEVAVRGGECVIRDLGSCNGTLVNGRFVEHARLRRGDVLTLGETEIRVR